MRLGEKGNANFFSLLTPRCLQMRMGLSTSPNGLVYFVTILKAFQIRFALVHQATFEFASCFSIQLIGGQHYYKRALPRQPKNHS